MESCIYEGWVRHRRYSPLEHAFRYSVFMMYLDLDELPRVFEGRWLWSTGGFAPAWFRRADHLGDPAVPLAASVRELVEQRTGRRCRGPIRLLTNLRYWGYCFNPVSFYYCLDPSGRSVETVVAELTNTPWGERYLYVLNESRNETPGPKKRFRFHKEFHVSPFMEMEIGYDWRFDEPGASLTVHMDCARGEVRILDATMALKRREIGGASLARTLAGHPFMTGKVISAIHLQALKLWWKKAPFYVHPSKRNLP